MVRAKIYASQSKERGEKKNKEELPTTEMIRKTTNVDMPKAGRVRGE